MALPKRRLRWILLIVILVLPLSIIAGVAWFVASDTWLHQTETRIAEVLEMEVSLDALAVASGTQHHIQGLEIADVFQAKTVQADGYLLGEPQRIIGIDQWQWTLNQNTQSFLLELLAAHAKQDELTVIKAVNGSVLSLQVNGELNSKGILSFDISGDLTPEDLHTIAQVFIADVFIGQLPDFIFADGISIDSCSVRYDTNTNAWQWDLRCHWAKGAAALKIKDGICEISSFSDERLPLFQVGEQAKLAGMPFKRATLDFDRAYQLPQLHLETESGAFWRIQIDARQDHCVFKINEGLLHQELAMLKNYLPQHMFAAIPREWDMRGSSWQWHEQGSPQGQLQLQAANHVLRSSWSLQPHLRLQNILVQVPTFSCAIEELIFNASSINCSGVLWTKAPQRMASICELLQPQKYTLSAYGIAGLKIEMDQSTLVIGRGQHLSLQAAEAPVALAHAFLAGVVQAEEGRPQLFASDGGRLSGFHASAKAGQIELRAQLHDVIVNWPLEHWRLPKGSWSYTFDGQGAHDWAYVHPNISCVFSVSALNQPGDWSLRLPAYSWHWQSALVDAALAVYLKQGVKDE